MAWDWPIPTGSDWDTMGWDAMLDRAAERVAPVLGYDGMGSYSALGTSSVAIQIGFVIHENEEVMVFKATDTVNMGDYIKVPN